MSMDLRTVNSIIVTNLSSSLSGLTWMVVVMIKRGKFRMSLSSFCMGAVCGLVVVTPASGFIAPCFGVVFGLTGICFSQKF
jgi:ammonia channel protein AmtB